MRIGFISLPLTGHVNPMVALARRLKSRGHKIIFIGIPDIRPYAEAAGLEFVSIANNEVPIGATAAVTGPNAKLYGPEPARRLVEGAVNTLFQVTTQYLPHVIAETGVEAMVMDIIHLYLELVPMSLGIPYAHVWPILNIDLTGTTPTTMLPGRYEDSAEARVRYAKDVKESNNSYFGYTQGLAEEYAERVGLKLDWSNPTATVSRNAAAIVSQTPKEFDLPGIPWPPQFHYAGPFYDDAGREPVAFPWEKLDGRPLIYASLGTLVNGFDFIYKTILSAVGLIPEIQVVLSKGNNIELAELGSIPPNVIVVDKAPQIELLNRSTLCITHAGLNTALESLGHGVPMVAIPIGFDQFGVALRIGYHGVGESVDVDDLTVDRLHGLIQKVLQTPAYREKAQYFKEVIAKGRGLDVAAEAIESAFERAIKDRPSGSSTELAGELSRA